MVADDNVTRSGDGLALPDAELWRSRREGRGRLEALVVTVEADAAAVERRLAAGAIACPDCGGVLGPWAWARRRVLRGVGGAAVPVRPRRSRCRACRRSHVLLPVFALLRRADVAAVIGAGLVAKAAGAGVRTVAGVLGVAVATVRGWLRRFASRAEAVRVVFTAVLVDLDADPVVPQAAGSSFADAVAAVLAVAQAVGRRWPVSGGLWRTACALSGGRLLAPGWPTARSVINTSCL